jgi:Family of unknown function (DUF6510)
VDAPRTAGRPGVIALEALDGNAIAGSLFECFGSEMTSVRGRCRHCGTVAPIAELAVYTRAPGAVARCRTCGDVARVLVNARGSMEFHAGAFELPESA